MKYFAIKRQNKNEIEWKKIKRNKKEKVKLRNGCGIQQTL